MNTELTLNDVVVAMNNGFAKVEYQLTEVKTELHELNGHVGRLEVKVDSIDERLGNLEQAFDRDAVTIVDHTKRIEMLELRPIGA